MIPTFPLEEERDDIDDWLECFNMQMKFRKGKIEVENERGTRDALVDKLGEDGVAKTVQQFLVEKDEGESNFEFEGPAMDVILMVQDVDGNGFDGDNNANNNKDSDDGKYFFKRSKSSLLLRSQSSMYGGLYAPKKEDGEEENDNHANGDESMQRQNSIHGGLHELVDEEIEEGGGDVESHDGDKQKQQNVIIIGGAAVEYYRQSRVGLLSYVVLHDDYRGCGLAKQLHDEALSRLEMLSTCYGGGSISSIESPIQQSKQQQQQQAPLLQAVFAETNTPSAGDVTPEQSLLRHKSLYNLGYRLVNFPYAQPPLSTEDVNASFDDILLLVYFPFDNDNGQLEDVAALMSNTSKGDLMNRYCPWFLNEHNNKQCCNNNDGRTNGNALNSVNMNINIPFRYIEDFYQSVFGYHSVGEISEEGKIPDYHAADYYKLARWFTHNREISDSRGVVEINVCRPTPWEDCKNGLLAEWQEWKEMVDAVA